VECCCETSPPDIYKKNKRNILSSETATEFESPFSRKQSAVCFCLRLRNLELYENIAKTGFCMEQTSSTPLACCGLAWQESEGRITFAPNGTYGCHNRRSPLRTCTYQQALVSRHDRPTRQAAGLLVNNPQKASRDR
jgi:hypothetical protein